MRPMRSPEGGGACGVRVPPEEILAEMRREAENQGSKVAGDGGRCVGGFLSCGAGGEKG